MHVGQALKALVCFGSRHRCGEVAPGFHRRKPLSSAWMILNKMMRQTCLCRWTGGCSGADCLQFLPQNNLLAPVPRDLAQPLQQARYVILLPLLHDMDEFFAAPLPLILTLVCVRACMCKHAYDNASPHCGHERIRTHACIRTRAHTSAQNVIWFGGLAWSRLFREGKLPVGVEKGQPKREVEGHC